jgi:hypothetical protein
MSFATVPEDYFMIWSKKGWAPRRKHLTFGDAIGEAKRLADLNPGVRYVVLHAIGSVEVPWIGPSAQAL